ncbi:Modification methylase ScrFIA [Durusdinium trenchii]|uniref:Modification methylase ScrFIA n=1 Tax=Durusdinium trenchii TaxID=1381693 RepID=A0ABP0JB22_9DINO
MEDLVALSDDEDCPPPLGHQLVALSDDEAANAEPVPACPVRLKKRTRAEENRCFEEASKRLHEIVKCKCRRKASCREPFKQVEHFEECLKERMRLSKMRKPDADEEIYKMLESQKEMEKNVLTLIDPSAARGRVVEYLTHLYHKVAEPMPELINPSQLKVGQVGHATYTGAKARVNPVRKRGKRPRSLVKRDDPSEVQDVSDMRVLPPSTIQDYHELCRAENPDVTISRKLFCKVWEESFRNRLVIRGKHQHKKCGVCVRLKLLLRRLKKSYEAKQLQLQVYKNHLEKQYADRTTYWESRGRARLGTNADGSRHLTLALDSMDHSKFAYPRDMSMTSKEFSNWARPTLSVTGILNHGHSCGLYVSECFVSADSSWSCEVVSHALHTAAQDPTIDLRSCCLTVIGDNSSKEGKNNSLLRLLSGLVCTRRLKNACMMFLQSGHSHEDWDQWFSTLATHMASVENTPLETPDDIVKSIQGWLDSGSTRPHEKQRWCMKVDEVRAWQLEWIICFCSGVRCF